MTESATSIKLSPFQGRVQQSGEGVAYATDYLVGT